MSLEPPSSSGLPGRSRPALSDLSRETTEGDLWNLDDDLTERAVSFPPQPRKGLDPTIQQEDQGPAAPQQPKSRGKTPGRFPSDPAGLKQGRSEPVDEIGDLDDVADDLEDEEDGVLRVIPEVQAAEPEVAPPAEDAPLPVPAARAAPTAPPEAPLAADTPATKPNQRRSPADATLGTPRLRFKRRELIGLAAFFFALLLAAIWVLARFFSAFEFKSEFVEGPDFPVKGQHIHLVSAETFWREPVRTGENRDFARREVNMIPVLELTLDPDHSASGALLVIYRNSQNDPVGDSIRRSFTGARFDASGSATIAFPSTDGFNARADFNAYRAGKGDSWIAEVFEGPSIDAPADQFKPLARIPVLPKLR
jgi:hypothetical protein